MTIIVINIFKVIEKVVFAYHVLDGEQGVDIQQISPPIFRAIYVIIGWRVEYGIIMEPCHCQLYDAQNEEIWCGKSAEIFGYFVKVIINH